MKQSGKLISSEKYRPFLEGLDYVFFLPENPFCDTRLSGHADLMLFSDGEGRLFGANFLKSYEIPLEIEYLNANPGEKYPEDAKFNGLCFGKTVIVNKLTIAGEILDRLEKGERRIVNVKQGYARCCALPVDENSLITSDEGIYRACLIAGLQVLKISPGYFELPGFDYGFVGGSGFLKEKKTLCFTGSIETHPDYGAIRAFLEEREIKIEYLTKRRAFDIGAVYC